MTWYPMAFLPPQLVNTSGVPYSGAVLKAYAAETSTVIPMATGSDGATTASSFLLNAAGYPVSGGNVIIPHVQENYKIALYPTQAAADADSGAVWTYDDVQIATTASSSFVQAFSGDGATTAFTVSEDLGTDENTLMVFTSDVNVGFFQKFNGDASTVAFTLSKTFSTDEAVLDVYVDSGIREHTTNGTFASDTGWTKGAGWTIGAGVATATGAISTALTQTAGVALIQDELYDVTYTITRSAGSVTMSLGGTSSTSHAAAGTFTEQVVAGAAQDITFTGAAFTGTVDTVSVKPCISRGYQIQDTANYTLSGTTLTFGTAPATGTGNIYVKQATISGTGVLGVRNPSDYTINGTTLTFDVAPSSGTNNILVFAPSLLFGALGAIVAAAATSETNAAASAAAAAASVASALAAKFTQIVKNVNYNVLTTDVIVKCNSGSPTYTLPDFTTVGTAVLGKMYVLMNRGTGIVTWNAHAGDDISGNTTGTLNQYESITFYVDGTVHAVQTA